MVSVELIQKSADGDKPALTQLLQENTGLIYMVINKFKYRGVEWDDLYQLAVMGFIKAVQNFNPSYSVQFSTYAVPVMMGEIKRFIRDDGMIRVSRSYKQLAARAAAVREKLTLEKGREPTVGEIAEKLSVTREELSVALSAVQHPASIEEAFTANNACANELFTESESESKLLNRLVLAGLIKALPEREQKIILWRYIQDETQAKVAKRLGISQVQVSRIERKILLKLRAELKTGL